MNIFYSWQSDTPSSIGKSFIRQALDDAVAEVLVSLQLDEADRPNIDQDTQGKLGSPAIAETIFEKIRESNVVVSDVTLVSERPSGDKLINSNVAIELGYALGIHGDTVLLKVMNTHFGSPTELPFDLAHRRWPVQFELSPSSTKEERIKERKKLAGEFAEILKLYLERRPPGKKYEPLAATANQATYWKDGEFLINRVNSRTEDGEIKLGLDASKPMSYLRIWPDEQLDELTGVELGDYQYSAIEPLFGRAGGYSYDRNKYGTISYSGENAGKLIAVTQLFKNREIWGVESYLLDRELDEYDFQFIPTQAVEQGFMRSLGNYLACAQERFDYSDRVHIEAGIVNVVDFRLAIPPDYDFNKFWGPIYEDINVKDVIESNNQENRNKFLLKLYEKIFDAAGKSRPANLYGFPPKQG